MEAQQIQPLAAVFGRGVPCAENDKDFAAEAIEEGGMPACLGRKANPANPEKAAWR